jgi:hypothetical protein
MNIGKSMLLCLLGTWAGTGAILAAAPAHDFSWYQVILERKPFGVPPVVASPAPGRGGPGAAAPQGAFINDLRMCAVTEQNDELRVGIVDIKNNKSYLFRLGETQDDITLVDADYQEECALLRKGAEEYWISLKGDATSGSPASGTPGVYRSSLIPPAAGGSAVASSAAAAVHESYADRLRKRREATRERVVEPPQMTEVQLQEHLKQYQMELIRAGGDKGPPLPIPLTPEMDAQLVSEGVLPPVQ